MDIKNKAGWYCVAYPFSCKYLVGHDYCKFYNTTLIVDSGFDWRIEDDKLYTHKCEQCIEDYKKLR